MEQRSTKSTKKQRRDGPAAQQLMSWELMSTLLQQLDTDSQKALRSTCKEFRKVFDSTNSRLQYKCNPENPAQYPPSDVATLERSVKGMVGRGGQPNILDVEVNEADPDWRAKAMVLLDALSTSPSVKELRLHGLLLDPEVAALIVAAAPGLTHLTLSGASSSRQSLQSGLEPLLRGTPRLQELRLCRLQVGRCWRDDDDPVDQDSGSSNDNASGASSSSGGGGNGANSSGDLLPWSALRDLQGLTSLRLELAGTWDAEAVRNYACGLASLTQLRSLSINDRECEVAPCMTYTLATICPALRDLRNVSLCMWRMSNNLLQSLSLLPYIESLKLRCRNQMEPPAADTNDVSCLSRMTTLTRLTLSMGAVLSDACIELAIKSSRKGSWALPPRLQSLEILDYPPSLLHLYAMSLPETLQDIRFSRKPVVLPNLLVEPGYFVKPLVRQLAGRGLTSLALAGDDKAANLERRALNHRLCLAELGPLQLQALDLRCMVLGGEAVEALAAGGLAGTLQQLELHNSQTLLVREIPALLRLRNLQRLTLDTVYEGSSSPPVHMVSAQQAAQLLAPCLKVLELKRAAVKAEAARVEAAVLCAGDPAAVAAAAEAARAAAEYSAVDAAAVAVVEAASRAATATSEAERSQALAAVLQQGIEPAAAAAAPPAGEDLEPVPLCAVLMEATLLLLLWRGVDVEVSWCHRQLIAAARAARDRIANMDVGVAVGELKV
ncbi:hypothetical protein PLESTF_000776100 [Pleodorina starrii]|nr:hypothetical protein PLESTM_000570900 [Pleodorina starrii]GLC69069.1 hypothetical protein PLESTF_000776100 [Pleodorina starrii]